MPKKDDFFGDEFDLNGDGKTDAGEEWLAVQEYGRVAGFDRPEEDAARRTPDPQSRRTGGRIAAGVARFFFAALLFALSGVFLSTGNSALTFLAVLTIVLGLRFLLQGVLAIREARRAGR